MGSTFSPCWRKTPPERTRAAGRAPGIGPVRGPRYAQAQEVPESRRLSLENDAPSGMVVRAHSKLTRAGMAMTAYPAIYSLFINQFGEWWRWMLGPVCGSRHHA